MGMRLEELPLKYQEQVRKKSLAKEDNKLVQTLQNNGKSKSKYGNQKCELDGIKFDSKKEMRRYTQLKSMVGSGDISNLHIHERFKTNNLRCENYLPDLKNEIEKFTKTKTVAELEEIIAPCGIPFGPINDIPTIADSELIASRNMLWSVDQPGMDAEIKIPGCPIKIHGYEDKCEKAAPVLGENNADVYAELLGYDEAKLAELEKDGVI